MAKKTWTDAEGEERTGRRDPMNDEHYDGNDEQIEDLKDLATALAGELDKMTTRFGQTWALDQSGSTKDAELLPAIKRARRLAKRVLG